jgi:hypothetical protein
MSIDIERFYEQQYPQLKPYIGPRFGMDGMPAILLIAESHYVPEDEDTKQHLDAEKWYAGAHGTTSGYTLSCINTADIFPTIAKKQPNSIHGILPREINKNGPRLENLDILKYLAFYNFYLRQAREYLRSAGDLKGPKGLVVTPLDTEYANAAFSYWVKKLNPTAIVFTSRNAWNHLDKSLLANIPHVSLPHPKRPWWNRTSKRYGNKTGCQMFADFIKSLAWPKN